MNEIFVYLDTLRGTAVALFGVTLLLAAGLVIFDPRRKAQPFAEQEEETPERKAA